MEKLPGKAIEENISNNPVFILAGRLGKNLTWSKILPVRNAFKDSRIYVFREKEGIPASGIEYITHPDWLSGIKIPVLKPVLRTAFELWQIAVFCRKHKPKLILAISIIPKAYYAYWGTMFCKTRFVVNIIGNTVEVETYFHFKALWKYLNLKLLKSADAVATKGEHVNRYLVSHGIDKKKIFSFNGFIDTGRFIISDQERDIDIAFVGTFRALKGPDRAVVIVHKLVTRFPGLIAFFAGEGPLLEKTKKMAADLHLNSHITFTGQTDHTENILKRSKVLVMPSQSEGLSTAMLEAMACGCIPVVSDVGCMSEAARHGYNAFLVSNYLDLQRFTEHIDLLLSDLQLRSEMAKKAISTVYEFYTLEKQTKAFDSIRNYLFE